MRSGLVVVALGLALAAGVVARAQEKPDGKDQRLRDPTDPEGRLRPPQGPASPGREPGALAQVPVLALRGLVVGHGRRGVALIEVAGQLHRVHEGSTVTVPGSGQPLAVRVPSAGRAPAGSGPAAEATGMVAPAALLPKPLVVRVVSLSRDEVKLEVQGSGETVTLR